MIQYGSYHIHGDNIVECERVFDLIKAALSDQLIAISGPSGSPVCPEYQLHLKTKKRIHFIFYPGFGRWNEDILQFIRERGGVLREAADVIITGVMSTYEEPLIAIEYCGALPAGNQAWQRNGRAYSFGKARIPYLYVAELGGYELDQKRNRKAPRMPNPAIPFSYLLYSLEQTIAILPVFVTSPGANQTSRQTYAEEFADEELVAIMRAILVGKNSDHAQGILRRKVLSFVQKRAATSRGGRTLSPLQWKKAYTYLRKGGSLVDFLIQYAPLQWSKTAYIDALTDTAKKLMEVSSTYAIGLTSTELPMCIIPSQKKAAFASQVAALYRNLPDDFVQWLGKRRPLTISWVMGFKPGGDDARPDRGLPPLTRMLIGNKHDLLTVVYGPAPEATWRILCDDPVTLAQRNGLWESIFAVSNGLLIDSATDNVTRHGFLRSHWEAVNSEPIDRKIFISPAPLSIGENDVDTILHSLFARYAGAEIFEGMCNPPGGDWSGISLLPPDRSLELRWVSLPRVSGENTKRPDHVFQIFGIASKPIIFSIESKETANAVEADIGPRLSQYLANLVASPASIERDSQQPWIHSTHHLNPDDFIFASGAAFISNSDKQIAAVIERANVDVIFADTFQANGKSCEIRLIPNGTIGETICNYIAGLDLAQTGISIVLDQ